MTYEKFDAPFKGRSLLNWIDWTPEEITTLLNIALDNKRAKDAGEIHQRFVGKTVAIIFEKRSTRTRCSFETAVGEEGGHPVFLSPQDIQMGAKESVKDTARVLGRMFSGIEFRGFKQAHVEELAKYSGIPVWNGLTDDFHPTQALADIMTLYQHFGYLKGLHVVYSGDGRNNVARSLMLICAKMGMHCTIITPKELNPDQTILDICKPFAEASGSKITYTDNIFLVKDADAVYTDVWTSMGEEALKEQRTKLLAPFQVNKKLIETVGSDKTVFLHCLPAVLGEEVTEDVFESKNSLIWEQAENRKHTIKAIMLATL
ncbi:MAG: ornithine carbamoyltransferase [Treponemataceae bacterium]|nr:ornithine carbamoyltransferase [Treponemataceae bacterium]